MLGSVPLATLSPDRRAAPSLCRLVAAVLRGADELSQLRVLETYGARGHFRDDRAAVAVHESAAQHEVLKPAPRRGKPHRAFPVALSCDEHLLRRQCCVALNVGFVLLKRSHGVMKQIAAQSADLSGMTQGFVYRTEKFRLVAPVQAPLKIRIPPGMFNPRSQIKCLARDFVNAIFGSVLLPGKQRRL